MRPAIRRLRILLLLPLLMAGGPAPSLADQELPARGLVTLVDVGAGSCIPCKMMAPILEELKREYEGRAVIAFVDLRYDREAAKRFAIRGIPTQIFYDAQGREVTRHLGFLDKEAIRKTLAQLGVE